MARGHGPASCLPPAVQRNFKHYVSLESVCQLARTGAVPSDRPLLLMIVKKLQSTLTASLSFISLLYMHFFFFSLFLNTFSFIYIFGAVLNITNLLFVLFLSFALSYPLSCLQHNAQISTTAISSK